MTMQHYKDTSDQLYAIEPEFSHMLPAGCIPITDEEAQAIREASAPPAPVPPAPVVSAWQIRKALNQLDLRDAVEQAVAQADRETRDAWEYATEFKRDHPLVVSLGAALGKIPEELDALFALAVTL